MGLSVRSLLLRTTTAVGAMVFFSFFLLCTPPLFFVGFVLGMLGMAAYEWSALLGLQTWVQKGGYVAVMCCAAFALWIDGSYVHHTWLTQVLLYVDCAFWLFVAPLSLLNGLETMRALTWRFQLLSSGVILLGFVAACFVLYRIHTLLVLMSWGMAWLIDIAAYFIGSLAGSTVLSPITSPRKTVEGAWGAWAVLSVAAGIFYAWPHQQWSYYIPVRVAGLLVPIVCAVAIIGDLYESALKRLVSCKDSGTLLPGHGGLLDRVDATLAILPVVALFVLSSTTNSL